MVLVLLVVAVGVVGIGVLVWYCITLIRRVAELAGEVAVLADQGGQLIDLLGQIELPADSGLTGARRGGDSPADVG